MSVAKGDVELCIFFCCVKITNLNSIGLIRIFLCVKDCHQGLLTLRHFALSILTLIEKNLDIPIICL